MCICQFGWTLCSALCSAERCVRRSVRLYSALCSSRKLACGAPLYPPVAASYRKWKYRAPSGRWALCSALCSAVFGIFVQSCLAWGCVDVNACSAVFGICVRGFGTVAPCHGDERVFGCVHCVRVFGSGLTRVFASVRQLHSCVIVFGWTRVRVFGMLLGYVYIYIYIYISKFGGCKRQDSLS